MPKSWPFETACTKAGELYGSLLARDSDRAGFQHVTEILVSGEASVRDIVRKFCISEEFREKHVMNQTPNEMARRIMMRFGKERPAPEDVKRLAVDLLERNWCDVIAAYIDSAAYTKAFGDDNIPVWI
jgi:hypothetical protein